MRTLTCELASCVRTQSNEKEKIVIHTTSCFSFNFDGQKSCLSSRGTDLFRVLITCNSYFFLHGIITKL